MIYRVISYKDDQGRLVDVARIDPGVKLSDLTAIAQRIADQLGRQVHVRKTDVADPARRARPTMRRNPKARTKRKRNPAAKASTEARALRTFRKWHQFDPKAITQVKGSRAIPARLVKLGEIPEIVYRSDKWSGKPQTYLHKCGNPRPLLCTDPDGKRLFIVGGRLRVTARGIVG